MDTTSFVIYFFWLLMHQTPFQPPNLALPTPAHVALWVKHKNMHKNAHTHTLLHHLYTHTHTHTHTRAMLYLSALLSC